MPNVTPTEKKHGKKGKEKYMSKCVSVLMKEGKSQDAALGACEGMWKDNWKKKKSKAGINSEPEEPDWDKDNETEFFIIKKIN